MIPLRLVIDTNIVVSAALKPDGLQRTVLLLAITKPARLYVTEAILAEYREVLGAPGTENPQGTPAATPPARQEPCASRQPQRMRSRSRRTPATTSFWSAPMLPVPTTW